MCGDGRTKCTRRGDEKKRGERGEAAMWWELLRMTSCRASRVSWHEARKEEDRKELPRTLATSAMWEILEQSIYMPRERVASASLFAGYQILSTEPTSLLLTLRLDASSQFLDVVVAICSTLFGFLRLSLEVWLVFFLTLLPLLAALL